MSPISSLSNNYLQSALSAAFQSAGLTSNTTGSTSSVTGQADQQQLSPLARLMNTLQQIQQSDPAKYKQVTQQIATNLQDAAKTAQAEGNSTAANQLNQLATDFTNASQSGQLPNVQDLAQAAGGHHHHHHAHAASTDSDTDSSSTSTSTSSTSQTLSQLLSSLQTGAPSDSLNPMTIILNTLSNAGIGGSNS